MITILQTADGKPLNKTFTHDKSGNISKQSYGNAFKFNAATADDLNGILDLSEILSALESATQQCVIRGVPRDPKQTQNIRRTLHEDEGGDPAGFKSNPNGVRWAMCDFDKIPVASLGLTTNEARLDYIVSLLPIEFQDVSYHYQWSASAGLNGNWDNLSCHLWFWLANPCSDFFLRNMFHVGEWKNCEVDPAPFSAVQPHYTAAPTFIGMDDPLGPSRSGLIHGEFDEVKIRATYTRVLPPPPAPELIALRGSLHRANHHGHQRRLYELLADIGAHYHRPIQRAIAHYVATTPPESRDRAFLLDTVKQAIQAAPTGKHSKVDYLSDRYLNRSIDGAERKYGRGAF